jgi:hypothetical protein
MLTNCLAKNDAHRKFARAKSDWNAGLLVPADCVTRRNNLLRTPFAALATEFPRQRPHLDWGPDRRSFQQGTSLFMKKNTTLCVLIGLVASAAAIQQVSAQAGNSGTFNTPAFGGTGSGAVNVNNNNNSQLNSRASTNFGTSLGTSLGNNSGTVIGQRNTALGQQGVGTAITAPAGTVDAGAATALTTSGTNTAATTAAGSVGNGTATTAQGTGIAIGQQGTTGIGQQGTGTALGQQGGTALTPQTNGFIVNSDGTTTGVRTPSAQGSSTGAVLGGTNTGFGSQTLTNGIRR